MEGCHSNVTGPSSGNSSVNVLGHDKRHHPAVFAATAGPGRRGEGRRKAREEQKTRGTKGARGEGEREMVGEGMRKVGAGRKGKGVRTGKAGEREGRRWGEGGQSARRKGSLFPVATFRDCVAFCFIKIYPLLLNTYLPSNNYCAQKSKSISMLVEQEALQQDKLKLFL